MLFWIFIIVFIIGITFIIIYDKTCVGEWFCNIGVPFFILGAISLFVSVIVLACSYLGIDGCVAKYETRYETIAYQYENDIYDNDNDLGKRELMEDIQEWNEDLAWHKENQDDFWIGIFIPNVYDQFEFIELKGY